MSHRYLEAKARNVPSDLGYTIGRTEDIIHVLKELDHEENLLIKMFETYSKGKYSFRHSQYFNPSVARTLLNKIQGCESIEDFEEFLKLCRQVEKDYLDEEKRARSS